MPPISKQNLREELMREMGRGRQMITSAEWNYGIGRTITLDTLNAHRALGNEIILAVLDRAEELKVRLPRACYF